MRQLGGVLRLELKKTAFSRRGWWIYLLAVAPVVLMLAHWLTGMRPPLAPATASAKTA